jgi:DNA-3-methyladenine glycosylase
VSTNGRAAPLPVSFFRQSSEVVARELLGTTIVSLLGGRRTVGRIVETEAYLGYRDPASHGYRHRRHAGNVHLFGPPGTWYVYRSYGIHWCANLVCGVEGEGTAILLRAVEPLEGLDVMRERRGPVDDPALCSGPGKLCQALAVTKQEVDGVPMRASGLTVMPERNAAPPAFAVTPRIGITQAADWPLRFVVLESPWISHRARVTSGRMPAPPTARLT